MPDQKLSTCHQAPVTIGGMGDFDDKARVVTQYYVCSKCSQPCDVMPDQNNPLQALDAILDEILDKYGYWLTGGELKDYQLSGNEAKAALLELISERDAATNRVIVDYEDTIEHLCTIAQVRDVFDLEDRIKQLKAKGKE